MNLNIDYDDNLQSLIETAPVEEPRSTIQRDRERTVITIEGRSAARLSSSAVTALIIFGISAFICPGIGLIAVLLLPLALLVLGGIYLFAPDMLKAPRDTQVLVIGPDQLRLYEGCPTDFDLDDDDDETMTPTVILPRENITEIAIDDVYDKRASATLPAIEFRGADQVQVGQHRGPLTFGQALALEEKNREEGLGELKWLLEIIQAVVQDSSTR